MPVPVKAALQPRVHPDEVLEHVRHVVVEHLAERRGMHRHHRPLHSFGHVVILLPHEIEIGDGFRVVELQRVRVQADKAGIPCREGKVHWSIHLFKGLLPRPEAIVVPQQAHVRHFQPVENVPHQQELVRHPEIRLVAAHDDKVDVSPPVDVRHRLLRLVIPPLCVADEGEAEALPPCQLFLNLPDVAGIHSRLPRHAGIVGMRLQHVARHREQWQYRPMAKSLLHILSFMFHYAKNQDIKCANLPDYS